MSLSCKFRLGELAQPFLLFEARTGVVYEHQCGGVEIRHLELEGFLVPFEDPGGDGELQDALTDIATKHGLEAEHVALVREALRDRCAKWERDWIWVDDDRIRESDEAWVYVGLDPELAPKALCLEEGDLPSTAVLIWQNSD